MSLDQLVPEALKLSPRERAVLAVSLWESLEDPYEVPSGWDDEAAVALAEARDQELERGDVVALSHAELMRRLRS